MEVEDREKLLEKHNILRQELKKWEREFGSNSGRKPGREDIKKHPAIAQKYKDYNRIRDILAGKAISQAHSSPQPNVSRKRSHETASETPVKRLAIAQTPSKRTLHPADIDPYDSPSLIRNLSPSKVRVIGPTPQKDGKALGLFDLLRDDDESSPTEIHLPTDATQKILMTTPRKVKDQEGATPRTSKRFKTPTSGRKRSMLETFMTPLKRRDINDQTSKTPSSVSKLNFSTPAFLRRDCQRNFLPTVAEKEDGTPISPEIAKPPRKPLLRGLSSILAGLRKMQEDAANEDLDVLREIENETAHVSNLVTKKPITHSSNKLLDGFDDEAKNDSEPEEVNNLPLGRDGQPLKIYKKKGQKRTTRRVVIKPVRSRSTWSAPQPHVASSPSLQQEKCATKSQQDETRETGELVSEIEYADSEKWSKCEPPSPRSTKEKNIPKEESMTKTAGASHANFRRLKLRNSGTKGAPARNGRFRRKR